MTDASKKDNVALKRIFYIYYLIWFKKSKIRALIDLGSKMNAITPTYAANLGLKI